MSLLKKEFVTQRFHQWAPRIVFTLIICTVAWTSIRDSVHRSALERRIHARTGMDVHIGKFSSRMFSPIVTIEDLKIYNPPEFGGTLFLDVPELYVEMDSGALAHNKLRIHFARLNLAELRIVRNQAGHTNIAGLLDDIDLHPPAKTSNKDKRNKLEFAGIDALNLTLGKAQFIDLRDPARNREVRVGLQNQSVTNINSEADIHALLFMLWLRTGGKFSMPSDVAGENSNQLPH
jgi:hypothetical protein